jgi:hypothetical protein
MFFVLMTDVLDELERYLVLSSHYNADDAIRAAFREYLELVITENKVRNNSFCPFSVISVDTIEDAIEQKWTTVELPDMLSPRTIQKYASDLRYTVTLEKYFELHRYKI